MKIKYVSDIHLEFFIRNASDMNKALSNFDSVEKDDILILAGDICNPIYQGDQVLNYICAKARKVLYVSGNHEYYGSSLKAVDDYFNECMRKFDNFHYLNNDCVEIDDVNFIGGTGWSNVSNINCSSLNDFKNIENMTPEKMSSLYLSYEKFISQYHNDNTITVMISHFLPSKLLISKSFAGDSLNTYFCNGIYDNHYNINPEYWIYGHDHSGDFRIKNGDTTFLTEQAGYGKVEFSIGKLNL